jgi:2-oxoglutarate dehydrogenase E2 component (dihydrolipoamide succinyltransferase)
LRRITRQDVNQAVEGLKKTQSGEQQPQSRPQGSRETRREKMSRLRRKLSERLVSVKNETAMLTTFNEVDMSEVIRLRKQYQKPFQEKHGVKLGFMSFFIKASAKALQDFPNVNSMIDGEEVVYPQYADIGIAVQTPKGLMVPVIRNAESLSLAELEQKVKELGEKGQKNRISIDEMEGGTFSITNGGVFGSMLSTPIINPPQSAILGMHNIQERPVAVEGQVVIRPMMYIALSYDHRTIDGKDSVSFLVRIKELLEKPQNLLLEGGNADKQLLGL